MTPGRLGYEGPNNAMWTRPIRFRLWDGWNRRYHVMRSFSLLNQDNKPQYAFEGENLGSWETGFEFDSHLILEPFTGFKDTKGVDIFENDIVQSSVIINCIAKGIFLVRWNDYLGNWALDWKGEQAEGRKSNPTARGLQNPYKDWDTDFAKLNGSKAPKLTVIGNAREHSHLLNS